MAIRRRRKTLTNLLSTMERRVTAVELRPINLLPLSAAVGDNENLDGGPDSVVSLDAPNQYKKVVEGYYYSSRITGVSKPRIELYFEADPGLDDDLTVRVSGVHSLRHSGEDVAIEASGDFKTINSDRPPYEDRASYSGERDTPDETTIDATVLYNPDSGTQYSARKTLTVKQRISTLEATTTTAKIVFTSNNLFKVGDIVYVDIRADEGPFFGIDGLHRVKEVGSNFITYDFSSALEEPINVGSVADEVYVHAVAQSAVRDGATWISSDNTVYVWKDYRWVLFTSATVPKDKTKPNPVTNLDATDENDTPDGSSNGLSKITLTWDAPTENEDGSSLDDLVGYTVWSKQGQFQEWEKFDFTGAETTWSKGNFQQGKKAYFTVFARDSGGNLSEGVELEYTTSVAVPTVVKPKAPVATTYLGTIKIAYDDLTATEPPIVQAATAKEIQVYFSDVDGFTPGPENYYGKFPANAGSYIIIPGTEIEDNTDYYIKIIVRDIFGNITEPSDQVSIRAKKSEIVTFDMIDVGSLTAQAIIGLQISTNENASVNGGIVLTQDFLAAYDEFGGQTFRIDAATGAVTIGAYLGRSEAEQFLTIADATGRYATIARADSISLVAGTAQATATAAQQGVDAARRDLDAVTTIEPGEISVSIKKDQAVKALNKGATDGSSTQITGGVIRSGTLLANKIGTGTFPVGTIYAGSIEVDQISAGTITGKSFRTNAADAQRVVMSASSNSLLVYNSSGTLVGRVYGGALSSTGIRLDNNGDEYLSLYPGVINLQGNNVGIQIRSAATKSSSTITLDSGRVNVPKFGTDVGTANGWGIVSAFNGTGLSDGSLTAKYLGGTSNGVVQVASDGFPFRASLSGTGVRDVFASSTGTLQIGSSDSRLKQNIETLSTGLDLISTLTPKKYEFKSDPGVVEYGLIAQELRESLDQLGIPRNANLVTEEYSEDRLKELPDGESGPILGIEYRMLIPILINSVKELKARIEILEQERDN